MLSEKLISDVVKFIESKVAKAELVIAEETREMEILRTETTGDMLKIFIFATVG